MGEGEGGGDLWEFSTASEGDITKLTLLLQKKSNLHHKRKNVRFGIKIGCEGRLTPPLRGLMFSGAQRIIITKHVGKKKFALTRAVGTSRDSRDIVPLLTDWKNKNYASQSHIR